MKMFCKSGNSKQSGSGSLEFSNNPENEVTTSKACSDIHRNFTDLTNQVQIMSDSLAAHKQISKYRPLRKTHDNHTGRMTRRFPQHPTTTSLPAEDTTQDHPFNSLRKNVTVSYVLKKNENPSHESLTTRLGSETLSGSYHSSKSYGWFGNSPSGSSEETSENGNSEQEELFDVIYEELKKLKGLNPSMVELINNISESISHYKECKKCSSQIVSALPWILSRIKELVEIARNNKRKSRFRSRFNSSLKESPKKKISYKKSKFEYTLDESDSKLEVKPGKKSDLNSGIESGTQTSTQQLKEIRKLRKVDAGHLVEQGSLGVPLLFDVKPEKKKKKIFLQSFRKSSLGPTHPVLFKKGPPVTVHHLILSDSDAEYFLNKKRKLSTPKEISFAHSLEFAFTSSESNSFLTFVPAGRISQFQQSRSTFYVKPVNFLEKRILLPSKNFITSCSQLTGNILQRGLIRWPPHPPSNEKKNYDIRNFLANAPETVKELLREAQETREDAMKELEDEVKGLKELVFKVHLNQLDLNKILLEEGIYSEPLIKLTDPNLLGEEFQVLRKMSEIENVGTLEKFSELERLKTSVSKVKKKCNLKLQMISTLVKGLKSNVPKEWWEESVSQAFDESQSIEEMDLAKIDEFIRQTKLFLMSTQKASGPSALVSRSEELPLKEEPKLKGLMGAKFEESLKNLSHLDHKIPMTIAKETDFNSVFDGISSANILSFPATSVPQVVDKNIRKLENQISLLNIENERLWHEVQELKELWEVSLKQLEESKRNKSVPVNQSVQETVKSPGKTINLTIQILSDKNSHRLKSSSGVKVEKYDDSHSDVLSKLSNCLPTVKSSDSEPDVNQESAESQDQKFVAKFNAKLDRRKSNYDLNFVDDSFPVDKNDKSDHSVRQLMMPTPHPSCHEIFQLIKPRDRSIPETSDGHQGKPTRKQDIQYLLQKPSLMDLVDSQNSGMHATMANERELQPIFENDHSDTNPSAGSSGSVTQAIQRLRSRVRSIHKEVTVLKSKNDRIDKLLDKLMNDAAENNKSFEKMGNSLNDLNNRLG